ncbi:NUDIX domain-containing protein, partial [Streptomyces sp. NPDC059802]|uniref:NUDIX hydrolase n=1 Tax=Streptomyces sp. NPDC059802 TaxID=3346952 RepID=UPI0036511B23
MLDPQLPEALSDALGGTDHPAPLLPGPREDACQGGAGAVKNVIGAHLLERDGRTLLGRRHPDVEFAGGVWHALAGHVEWESVRACLIREAFEEAGIIVEPADLTLVHTVHLLDDGENAEPRIQLFLRASRWSGEPEVREPDRCTAWQWWPLDGLPDLMVGYTRAAIEGILAGTAYTELGWAPAVAGPRGGAGGGRRGGRPRPPPGPDGAQDRPRSPASTTGEDAG